MNLLNYSLKISFNKKEKIEVGDQVSYRTMLGKATGIVKDIKGSNARIVVEDSYSAFSQWINLAKLTLIS